MTAVVKNGRGAVSDEVTREHREAAAVEWYWPLPWQHRQVLSWVATGEKNAGISASLDRYAQALAEAEARGRASVAVSDEQLATDRNAWAIRVLDSWAALPVSKGLCGESWTCERYDQGKEEWKVCATGKGGRVFFGHTPDAARLTAAEALAIEEPSLDRIAAAIAERGAK